MKVAAETPSHGDYVNPTTGSGRSKLVILL